MAGGYEHKQGGTEGVAALLHGQQQQLNALRSGAGIKSSIIRGVRLLFQDDNGATIGKFGTFSVNYVDAGGDMTGGTAQGSLYQNPATGRFLFIASANPVDGVTNVQAGDAGNWDALAAFRAYCTNTNIWASGTAHIHGGAALQLTSLAYNVTIAHTTTGSAANAYLDAFTGRIYRSTSSRRQKTDIADAEVDPADVLAMQPRTWVDTVKVDLAEDEGDLRRDVGFIAEELDELPSLRQFVQYNAEGEPDAIEYDRLSVALLTLAKAQAEQLTAIEKRLDALEAR